MGRHQPRDATIPPPCSTLRAGSDALLDRESIEPSRASQGLRDNIAKRKGSRAPDLRCVANAVRAQGSAGIRRACIAPRQRFATIAPETLALQFGLLGWNASPRSATKDGRWRNSFRGRADMPFGDGRAHPPRFACGKPHRCLRFLRGPAAQIARGVIADDADDVRSER